MSNPTLTKVLSISTGVLFVANLVLAFSLIDANKKLKSATEVVTQGLRIGDKIGAVPHGIPEGTPRVFAFLSYQCPHCETDIPAWNEINANVPVGSFIPVSLDMEPQPEGSFADDSFHAEVWNMHNQTEHDVFMQNFKIEALPMTVVLSDDNTVLFVFAGELTAEDVNSIIGTIKQN